MALKKTRVLVLAEWDESLHWVPAPTAAKTRVFQYFRPEISPHGEEYLLLFVCCTVSLRSYHSAEDSPVRGCGCTRRLEQRKQGRLHAVR